MEFPVGFIGVFARIISVGLLLGAPVFAAEGAFDYPLSSSAIMNQEVELFRVTSDIQSGYSDIKLVADSENNAVGMKYLATNGDIAEFSGENLSQGVVVYKRQGYNVLKLQSNDFSSANGGNLKLIYLLNGLTGKYGVFEMELVRNGDQWSMQVNDSSGRRTFTRMHIEGRKIMGKVVGIKRITVD